MENSHSELISPEKAAELLAKKRAEYDAMLAEVRLDNVRRAAEDLVREQGSIVIRIAAQGD